MMPAAQALTAEDSLALGWQAVLQSVERARHAPLSARQALHAAVLLDQVSELTFLRRAQLSSALAKTGDILTFRAALRGCDPALGPLMDLTACGAEGPRLQVVAVAVPADGFATLPVADLMVSLYNAGTVPRLMLVQHDGTQLPMQELLQQTAAWWCTTLGPQAADQDA